MSIVPGTSHIGEVQAWNVDTGARVWTHTFAKSSNWGPLLATSGGLVLAAEPRTACSARSTHGLERSCGVPHQLRRHRPGVVIHPQRPSVRAVQSGWGIDARGMQNRLNAIRPGEFPEVPEGGAVWVFALGD